MKNIPNWEMCSFPLHLKIEKEKKDHTEKQCVTVGGLKMKDENKKNFHFVSHVLAFSLNLSAVYPWRVRKNFIRLSFFVVQEKASKFVSHRDA